VTSAFAVNVGDLTKTKMKEFPINMKRSVSALCLLASALGVNALAQTADTPSAPAPAMAATTAAPAGPSKVAVIMFEAAVAQTNEGQRNIGQIRQKFDPKQAQLKSASDEIESLKKKLQTAPEADKPALTKSIDQKEKALQRDAEAAQTDFNSEMNDMYQSLAQKVYNTVQTYAAQNGYTVVLDAGGSQQQPTVLWANEGANITLPVVQAYNAKSGVPAQPASSAPPAGATRTPSTAPRSTAPKPTTKPQ
jgi:outer membrane protein